jgi:hypothetical protein
MVSSRKSVGAMSAGRRAMRGFDRDRAVAWGLSSHSGDVTFQHFKLIILPLQKAAGRPSRESPH